MNWFKLFYWRLEWTFDFFWTLNFSRCCLDLDLWTRAWKPWMKIWGMSTFNLWTLNFELWTSSFALHCLECLDFRLNFFKQFELWDFVWSHLDFVKGGQSNFRLYLKPFWFCLDFFLNLFGVCLDFRLCLKLFKPCEHQTYKFWICEISLGNFNWTFFELVQIFWILNTRFFNVEIGEFWNLLNTFG